MILCFFVRELKCLHVWLWEWHHYNVQLLLIEFVTFSKIKKVTNILGDEIRLLVGSGICLQTASIVSLQMTVYKFKNKMHN